MVWAVLRLYASIVKPKAQPADPTPTVKMTLDEYEARLQAKIATALKERDHATGKDLDIKNAQIAELKNDLANIEQSFEKQKQFIAKLETDLKREGNTLGADALEKATQALEAGDTSLAETLFQQIKDRTEPDVQASARASFALGEIAEKEVRWQEAFQQYDEAARLHPRFQNIISAQKMALHLAVYDQAESLGRAALSAAEKEFGKGTDEYGTALSNLASLLAAIGRFDEAEPLFRQALEITRAERGEAHPDFGIRLNNLAKLLRDTERFEEAEPLYRQALENARAALEKGHPDFGTHLNNLAGLLSATGRFEEAKPLYRQAVGVFEKALGPDHPNTQTVKANFEGFLANRPPAD